MVARNAAAAAPPEQKVRQKLCAVAAQEFGRKGYAAASVREIVGRAGVTKPVLYYYFGSKEGIYRAVLEAALQDFESRLRAVESLKGSAARRLRRLCEAVFAMFERHFDLVRLMHSILYGAPGGAPFFDFKAPLQRLHDVTLSIVRQGVRTGEFRGSPVAMTLAVLGAVNECVDLVLVQPELAVDRAGFKRVLGVVLQGMKGKVGR